MQSIFFVVLIFCSGMISPALCKEKETNEYHESECSAINPKSRVECGWRGISEDHCLSRGCCYNTTITKSIWCFKKDTEHRVSETSVSPKSSPRLRSCAVNVGQRVNCGWRGISPQTCEKRGCCYDDRYRKSYWCFKSDRLYVDKLMWKILHCTATCAHVKWSKISETAIQCKLDEECWVENINSPVLSCLKSCKIQENEVDADETHAECDFSMSCWVLKYGHSAMECYRRYSKFLHGITFEDMSSEEMEKDMPSPPPEQRLPEEPGMNLHKMLFAEILREQPPVEHTNINNEISVIKRNNLIETIS